MKRLMKLTTHNAKASCYVNKKEEKEEDDMNGKLFIGSILAGVFALAHTSFSAEWKPVAGTMMTESGENISPDNAASTGSEKQSLSPETEMAILRVMNLENRIQTLQTVPAKMTNNELADHFSGTWICFTTMRLNGQLGRGIMEIRLEQDGDKLVGEGGQLKHPFDPPATIRPIGTRSAAVSDFIGQFKKASKGRHNMVVIERQRVDGPTWATFTAVMAGDGRTARGTLVNAGGNYGLMFMVRREFLADFKHLLTEEGRRAESQRRWIGIENLEVALDTASMDTARIEWWKTDKNKDGKLQYLEFPHPEWKRANRNNDDVVDWAEEVSDRVLKKLAEEGDFLAKHGNDSQKQWPSIYAWGVAHPVSNRSSTSSIGIAMKRSPRRNTRPLMISWTLTTIHPSQRQTKKDKLAKTFGRRIARGRNQKASRRRSPTRTRTLCKWRPPSVKRSWPSHRRCGPLSIKITTSSGSTVSFRIQIGNEPIAMGMAA